MKKIKKKNIDNAAKNIGNGLAHVQALVDNVINFGFKKLSKASGKKLPKDTHIVKKVIYGTGGFIGDIGKNFYKKYAEIKEEEITTNKK